MTRTWKLKTFADGIPFGHYPPYPTGPAIVAHDDWSTSCTTGAHIDGAIVSARRLVPDGGEQHELNGKLFPSREEARRALYEAGLIAYMVYDDTEWADYPDFVAAHVRAVRAAMAAEGSTPATMSRQTADIAHAAQERCRAAAERAGFRDIVGSNDFWDNIHATEATGTVDEIVELLKPVYIEPLLDENVCFCGEDINYNIPGDEGGEFTATEEFARRHPQYKNGDAVIGHAQCGLDHGLTPA